MSAINEFKKLLLEAAKKQMEEEVEQQESDTSVPVKSAEYLNKSQSNDKIPADPKNIEAQRWNDPLRPLDQKFVTFEDMNKHYNIFLQRIQQQMSSLGGGGEVNFRNLDDVDSSTSEYYCLIFVSKGSHFGAVKPAGAH